MKKLHQFRNPELVHVKIHENRLWRWDFYTLESFSHNLRRKCADLPEMLKNLQMEE
jgi:hypothetical protein